MAEEKKRYESGAVIAAVLGVAAGVGVLAIAAAASAGGGKPKPPPPKKGCTRVSHVLTCTDPGPESLMEFVFDAGYYIDSMDIEVELTGIGALDGMQKDRVGVRILILDEAGNLKKGFVLRDLVTPSVLKLTLDSVGVIGRSVLIEAVWTTESLFSSAPIIGAPVVTAGPGQLTLTRDGHLVASVR
jgi:hypothetical protein